jgi:hypothetical protein
MVACSLALGLVVKQNIIAGALAVESAHFMAVKKQRKREAGPTAQYLLQGHSPNDLTSFYKGPLLQGSTTSQQHHRPMTNHVGLWRIPIQTIAKPS